MSENAKTINERIADYRNLAGYTQEEAAAALGMNKSTYARMEHTGSPKTDTLKKISELFNVSVDVLIYGKSLLSAEMPNDRFAFHDVGIELKKEEPLSLSTNEKNCVKLCRTLGKNERTELMKYIRQYVDEHRK